MEVLWTKFALNSLNKIYQYHHFNAGSNIAAKIKDEILEVTQQLIEHPLS